MKVKNKFLTMNKIQVFNYLRSILILTIILYLIASFIFKSFGFETALKHLYFLTLMFFVVSLSFHFIFLRFFLKKPKSFVNVFLILTVVKILLYLSVLIAYIFKMEANIKVFLFTFMGLYFSFTAFEVVQLIKSLKNKSLDDQLIK